MSPNSHEALGPTVAAMTTAAGRTVMATMTIEAGQTVVAGLTLVAGQMSSSLNSVRGVI